MCIGIRVFYVENADERGDGMKQGVRYGDYSRRRDSEMCKRTKRASPTQIDANERLSTVASTAVGTLC